MKVSHRVQRRLVIALLVVNVVAVTGLALWPVGHVTLAWLGDTDDRVPPAAGHLDDRSRLEAIAVADVVRVPADDTAASVVTGTLRAAALRQLPVAIAGGRTSTGGQALAPDAVVLDLSGRDRVAVDPAARTLTAGAGATWGAILRAAAAHGLSPRIAPPQVEGTVGGAVATNAHGLDGTAPIGAAVRQIVLVAPDGSVHTCGPDVEPTRFALAVGGFGLTGVILDVTLELVDDVGLDTVRTATAPAEVGSALRAAADDPEVELAYARFPVDADGMFDDALVTTYRRRTGPPSALPPQPPNEPTTRAVHVAAQGSPYGKRLKWRLERGLGPSTPEITSRNAVLDWSLAIRENRSEAYREAWLELSVPVDRFEGLRRALRALLPEAVEVMDATATLVRADTVSALRRPRVDSVVLLLQLRHPHTPEGDATVAEVSRTAIDATLDLGGSFGLAYRPRATRAQLDRGYPDASAFFAAKDNLDPDGILQGGLWRHHRPDPLDER